MKTCSTCIVKINDYYLLWSRESNAPTCYGMPLKEFTEFIRTAYGDAYLHDEHGDRMKRVEKYGTSVLDGPSHTDLIMNNRAGPTGENVSIQELVKLYLPCNSIKVKTRRPELDWNWT